MCVHLEANKDVIFAFYIAQSYLVQVELWHEMLLSNTSRKNCRYQTCVTKEMNDTNLPLKKADTQKRAETQQGDAYKLNPDL